VQWAATQHNLGYAYSELPSGDRGANLRGAIACYESTLRVYTESDFPVQWATIQYNLGTAYSNLPSGNRGENLQRAIACYESALRVWTELDLPADWAMTQYNLGLVLRDSGGLEESVRAFDAAARGYDSVGDPVQADEARREAEESRRMSNQQTG
jgi:tetratricopeptide (TPR) repeat protein